MGKIISGQNLELNLFLLLRSSEEPGMKRGKEVMEELWLISEGIYGKIQWYTEISVDLV